MVATPAGRGAGGGEASRGWQALGLGEILGVHPGEEKRGPQPMPLTPCLVSPQGPSPPPVKMCTRASHVPGHTGTREPRSRGPASSWGNSSAMRVFPHHPRQGRVASGLRGLLGLPLGPWSLRGAERAASVLTGCLGVPSDCTGRGWGTPEPGGRPKPWGPAQHGFLRGREGLPLIIRQCLPIHALSVGCRVGGGGGGGLNRVLHADTCEPCPQPL